MDIVVIDSYRNGFVLGKTLRQVIKEMYEQLELNTPGLCLTSGAGGPRASRKVLRICLAAPVGSAFPCLVASQASSPT